MTQRHVPHTKKLRAAPAAVWQEMLRGERAMMAQRRRARTGEVLTICLGGRIDADAAETVLGLLRARAVRVLRVDVDSTGGEILAGMSIAAGIVAARARTYVHIQNAASAAALIAAIAKSRAAAMVTCEPDASWIWHATTAGPDGPVNARITSWATAEISRVTGKTLAAHLQRQGDIGVSIGAREMLSAGVASAIIPRPWPVKPRKPLPPPDEDAPQPCRVGVNSRRRWAAIKAARMPTAADMLAAGLLAAGTDPGAILREWRI